MSLKIAVVGTGEVARRNYLPFLKTQTDVTLAYYNRTAEKAQQAARDFGGEAFASIQQLVAWQPTAVLVLTAETIRHELGTAVIDAGAPRVFFEKPLVAMQGQSRVQESDFAKGREMLTRAKARGCETAMIFNYRFFEQSLRAREIVAARKFGRVITIAGQVHYACWSHAIDLIHCFAGGVAEIAALSGPVERAGDRVDPARDVAASFVTLDGAAGTLIGTAGMKWQHPLFELTFTFEHGRIHLRDLDGTIEILDGARCEHEVISFVRHESRWSSYDESFRKAIGAYLKSLREGTPPPVPGLDGLRELQVEAALKRSIKEKRPVNLAQEFPLL